MKRNQSFISGQIYHVCNKSIANFKIFKEKYNAERFMGAIDYYNNSKLKIRYSKYLEKHSEYVHQGLLFTKESQIVKILSYCIMPDHYHLLIKINHEISLSKYIGDVENSFVRYFNLSTKRKGPLWQSRFRAVHIGSNEQLLHISRYIHLNPTTSNLVKRPEDWIYSSYRETINNPKILSKVLLEFSLSNPQKYKKFVENNMEYQRKLKEIKKLLLD